MATSAQIQTALGLNKYTPLRKAAIVPNVNVPHKWDTPYIGYSNKVLSELPNPEDSRMTMTTVIRNPTLFRDDNIALNEDKLDHEYRFFEYPDENIYFSVKGPGGASKYITHPEWKAKGNVVPSTKFYRNAERTTGIRSDC